MISNQGLSVDPAKIAAIQQWPEPKSVKEVRSFLGLAGYYRKFIHHYATIAGPLTDLLRKVYFLGQQLLKPLSTLSKANSVPHLS